MAGSPPRHADLSSASSVSTPDSVRSRRRSVEVRSGSRSLSNSVAFGSAQIGLGHSNGLQLGNRSPTVSPFSTRFRRRSFTAMRPRSIPAAIDSEDSDTPYQARPRSRRSRQRGMSPQTASTETLKDSRADLASPMQTSPAEFSSDSSVASFSSERPAPSSNFTSPLDISLHDAKLRGLRPAPAFRAVQQRPLLLPDISTVTVRKLNMRDVMPAVQAKSDNFRTGMDFFESNVDEHSQSEDSDGTEYADEQFAKVWDRFVVDVCGGEDPSWGGFDFDVTKAFIESVSAFLAPDMRNHFDKIKVGEAEAAGESFSKASANELYHRLLKRTLDDGNRDYSIRLQRLQGQISELLEQLDVPSDEDVFYRRKKEPVLAVIPGGYQRSGLVSSPGYESPASLSASPRDGLGLWPRRVRSSAPSIPLQQLSRSLSDNAAIAHLSESEAQSPRELLDMVLTVGKEQGRAEGQIELDTYAQKISALEKQIATEKHSAGQLIDDAQVKFEELLVSVKVKDQMIHKLEAERDAVTVQLREQETIAAESQSLAEIATAELGRFAKSAREQEEAAFVEKQRTVDLEADLVRINGLLSKRTDELADVRSHMRPLLQQLDNAAERLAELAQCQQLIADLQQQKHDRDEHVEQLNLMIEDLRHGPNLHGGRAKTLEAELAGEDYDDDHRPVSSSSDRTFAEEKLPQLSIFVSDGIDTAPSSVELVSSTVQTENRYTNAGCDSLSLETASSSAQTAQHYVNSGCDALSQHQMVTSAVQTAHRYVDNVFRVQRSSSPVQTEHSSPTTQSVSVQTESTNAQMKSKQAQTTQPHPKEKSVQTIEFATKLVSTAVQTEDDSHKSEITRSHGSGAHSMAASEKQKPLVNGAHHHIYCSIATQTPQPDLILDASTPSPALRLLSRAGISLPSDPSSLKSSILRAVFYLSILWLIAASTLMTRELLLWQEANSVVSSTLAAIVHGEGPSTTSLILPQRLLFAAVQRLGAQPAIV